MHASVNPKLSVIVSTSLAKVVEVETSVQRPGGAGGRGTLPVARGNRRDGLSLRCPPLPGEPEKGGGDAELPGGAGPAVGEHGVVLLAVCQVLPDSECAGPAELQRQWKYPFRLIFAPSFPKLYILRV